MYRNKNSKLKLKLNIKKFLWKTNHQASSGFQVLQATSPQLEAAGPSVAQAEKNQMNYNNCAAAATAKAQNRLQSYEGFTSLYLQRFY